jgi:RHS repeat-associated protein
MKHQKPLHLLWLVLAFLLAATGDGYTQTITWNPDFSVGTVTGNYAFSYNQTPDELVVLNGATSGAASVSYQWMQSTSPILANFTAAGGSSTSTSYSFTGPLPQTMYYLLKAYSTSAPSNYVYSNVIKIRQVSVNWEDYNYVREYLVDTAGITTWQAADQLPAGEELQVTSYKDGLGRAIEQVTKSTATPSTAGGLWGDNVRFKQYDALGRETRGYLAYSTTNASGKFKTTVLTDQAGYYSTNYGETNAFDSVAFENNPLERTANVRGSGTSWSASVGASVTYDVNTAADSVQIWVVDYKQGDAPVNGGTYPAGALYKQTFTDVNGSMIVEYRDYNKALILKKIQVAASPSTGYAGWSCTYSVYDEFGLLRYQIQPVGVQYLASNAWSFAGTNGATILAEQCYQYNYDDKGRITWKKLPGASPLNMLYDSRDRLVFTQDGNQSGLSTPQWTANLYDALDRVVERVLYNTSESISSLQTDINNAVTITTYNIPAHTAAPPNLSYDTRNTSIASYVASQSISFVSDANGNFQTPAGDHFIAYIDPTPSTPAYSGTAITLGSPISAANLANASVTTPLKYFYYDNYSFPGAKSFSSNFNNSLAYGANPDVEPIATDPRVMNFLTGTQTRVLGTNVMLNSTQYYDIKGRQIQTLADNIKGGTDVTTGQYHFDGRILSTSVYHTAPGTLYSGFAVLKKYVFDLIGRVSSMQEQIGTNAFKTVASYDYDDMSRVKTKHLDPGYNNPNLTGPDLEALNYSFNLHGEITGINKDYALKTPATYNKWGHFFGMYIGYDNRDNVFNASQLNGQITGIMWNTQGDDAQRRYDYSYDYSARLKNAAFEQQQHPGDGWSKTAMDLSVTGYNGQITYDLNGNLVALQQQGVIPGQSAPLTIDDLRYSYLFNGLSNRLQNVTDMMTSTAVNGLSGDFKDGTNTGNDYVFDADGNMVVDLNKNIQSLNNGATGTNGVHYNYLDKPDQIRLVGQGTVEIVYDADGRKLQRAFIPETSGPATVTTYIGNFVYQSREALTLSSAQPYVAGAADTLSMITFEEGRIRVITTSNQTGLDVLKINGNLVLPGTNQMGVWDYFLRDYQENVRMVLTEEVDTAGNTCTMETGRATTEDAIFGQPGAASEVESTRVPTPFGWTSVNTSASVSELGNTFGKTIGPNTLQKVMAGDMVTASVQYYYQSPSTSSNPNIIPNILSSLTGALGGNATAGTLVHGNAAGITNQLSNSSPFMSAVEPSNATSGTPQAYLTILFFDERFNLISAADGGVQQQQVASSWTTTTPPLGLSGVKAPKNGYVYVYVSNRSDQPVYFDNLAVSIAAGNIIEEDHYYPFGLKAAAISSRKLGNAFEGTLKNNYLFGDHELNDDGGLNWYDYGYRDYDPQTGKFLQMDPLTDDQPLVSPYQYAFNDPITNADKNGLIGIPCPGTSAFTIFLDKVGEALTNVLSDASVAISVVSISTNVTNTALHVETVIKNSEMINGQTISIAVGGTFDESNTGPGPHLPVKLKLPPIFWEEFLTPAIEEIDYEYSLSGQANMRMQVIFLKEYPNVRFLVFHYEPSKAAQLMNGEDARDANRDIPNTNPRAFDLHEVPYKSTKEGGLFSIMREAPRSQNRAHGAYLRDFYERFNLKDGDAFLVPLYLPSLRPRTVPVPAHKVVPQPVPEYKFRPIPLAPPIPDYERKPKPILPPVIPEVLPELVPATEEGIELWELLELLPLVLI